MPHNTVLIVPGLHGSDAAHWQTWFEERLPQAQRVEQDWSQPILAMWVDNIRNAIQQATGSVWLIAHSFGCLATVIAAFDCHDKVAGIMLVAPASPERFHLGGLHDDDAEVQHDSIRPHLPTTTLPFPSLLVASSDDPWFKVSQAIYWGEQWGSRVMVLANAGHINSASGFGAWPQGLCLFQQFQDCFANHPLGGYAGEQAPPSQKGRGGGYAKLRHETRQHFGLG